MLVPESEREAYTAEYQNPILTIPDNQQGLGQVRNWVLDNFDEETVVMIDDDIDKFYLLTRERTQAVTDPDQLVQIIINTAVMAKDLGVAVFGFSQTDIRKYKGCEPFKLCTWVGCIIGIIGRKYRFRNDKFKVDIDYCLQTLLNERVIWMDTRYYASQARDNNTGGNNAFRTKAGFDESIESLKQKWRGCIRVSYAKTQVKIGFTFKRKAVIKI